MSPRPFATPPIDEVATAVARVWTTLGIRVRDARIEKRWSVRRLAVAAGVSADVVYLVESGHSISMEGVVRIGRALGRRLDFDLLDPRARTGTRQVDIVHSAMGEFEAAHLRGLGFPTALDEPYQHYQFAGRADVIAWDVGKRALLHLENRTRNPDFQAAAGAYNGKRAYLGAALAARLGVASWTSETHVIAALWSSEMLHAIRLRPESFRSLCPDPADACAAWWEGNAPADGTTSTLIVLDPTAAGRLRPWIDFETALTARPRGAGYSTFAEKLQR